MDGLHSHCFNLGHWPLSHAAEPERTCGYILYRLTMALTQKYKGN